MKRLFVELPAFTAQVRAVKFSDAQLRGLQQDIAGGRGDVIPGTGGLKKVRCAREHGGKRGGWRVVFADYPLWGVTLLVLAFPKNVKANLSPAEAGDLKRLKALLDREMEVRYGSPK